MDPQQLIDKRNSDYGDAWKTHGLVAQLLLPQLAAFLQKWPAYYFSWTMILNKLIRALTTPENVDHWRDIQGYAQLILNDLENKK